MEAKYTDSDVESGYETPDEYDEKSARIAGITLIGSPTQSGKTFECIRTILNRIEDEEKNAGDQQYGIHIVATMNIINANTQFVVRIIGAVSALYGNDAVAVLNCDPKSKKDLLCKHFTRINKVSDLVISKYARRQKTVRVLVVCTNETRVKNMNTLIDDLGTSFVSDRMKLYMYFDELHAYINRPIFRDALRGFAENPMVKSIIGLSATPLTIWDESDAFFRNVLVHNIQLDMHNYFGVCDMIHEPITPTALSHARKNKSALQIIKDTLCTKRELYDHGTFVFVPALFRTATHTAVKEYVFAECPDAVVVIINGTTKAMYDAPDHCIELDAKKEMCYVIKDAYATIRNARGYRPPLFITGYKCLSMSQTLMEPELLGPFTHMVFADDTMDEADAYQLVRGTGNIRAWPTFRQTKILCSNTFLSKCLSKETGIKNLSIEYGNSYATADDYMECCVAPRPPPTLSASANCIYKMVIENVSSITMQHIQPIIDEMQYVKNQWIVNTDIIRKIANNDITTYHRMCAALYNTTTISNTHRMVDNTNDAGLYQQRIGGTWHLYLH